MSINIIIPMAGDGRRFKEKGYKEPKPFIKIRDKRMIELVIENITPKQQEYNLILIAQEDHYKNFVSTLFDIRDRLKQTTKLINFTVIQLKDKTDGAACTILAADKYVNNNEPLVIVNSDQIVKDFDFDNFYNKLTEQDGLILVFDEATKDPKWSYIVFDKKGNIIGTVEKQALSSKATVGIYGWKEGSAFVASANEMIKMNDRTNGEFYVCPAYNYLIYLGGDFKLVEIEKKQMIGLGTPEDLERYLNGLQN